MIEDENCTVILSERMASKSPKVGLFVILKFSQIDNFMIILFDSSGRHGTDFHSYLTSVAPSPPKEDLEIGQYMIENLERTDYFSINSVYTFIDKVCFVCPISEKSGPKCRTGGSFFLKECISMQIFECQIKYCAETVKRLRAKFLDLHVHGKSWSMPA